MEQTQHFEAPAPYADLQRLREELDQLAARSRQSAIGRATDLHRDDSNMALTGDGQQNGNSA